MSAIQKSLRIPHDIVQEIEGLARNDGKEFTTVANELLRDAIRVYKCPGIVFAEGTTGKRARIAGTGIDVWEVIAVYKSVGKSFQRLHKSFHWLTEQQLKVAIGYYHLYTEEIDFLIKKNENWTPKEISKKYPFLG